MSQQSVIQHIVSSLIELNQGYEFKKNVILDMGEKLQYPNKDFIEMFVKENQVRFGYYSIESYVTGIPREVQISPPVGAFTLSRPIIDSIIPTVDKQQSLNVYVPNKSDTFIKWGEYSTIEKVIKSGKFFPIFISGLSGNGKSLSVEQACANLGREMMRVQIDATTDAEDLIGNFTLVNGETIFNKGPVIQCMERGMILLIDECDRGHPGKLLALQGVLEGTPVLLKKTMEVIHPKAGFNVIATANTLGRGSEDGKYVANIIDDAFLERFAITIEQEYPSQATERRIVLAHMEKYGNTDEDFASKLVSWSSVIRKTYEDDGIDELISTRRLCHIAQTFSIFPERLEAIRLCIARFEKDTRNAFLDLYTKVDPVVKIVKKEEEAPSNAVSNAPF